MHELGTAMVKLVGFYIPSGYVKIAIEHGPVEIVDLPSYIAW